jgi:sRNA-binding carbon storage regulator CsrA
MLVVSRKKGQEVFITHAGERLRVVLIEASDSQVRLGFEGPISFEILRDDAKRKEQ